MGSISTSEIFVGIYVRISSDEQKRTGLSIDAQIRVCIKYCELKGWKVYRIYKDEGISAGTLKKRPAIQEFMKDAEDHKVSCLVSTKLDRVFRNLSDAIKVLDRFREIGVNFAFVEQDIDTTSAIGRVIFVIIALFAELERQMTIERNRAIMSDKFDRGIPPSKIPYGYKPIFKNKEESKIVTRIEIDTSKAKIVQNVFKMTSEGISYKDICNKFNLAPQSYYNILKNKVYMGIITFEGHEKIGNHEPLISKELWEKCNG